MRFLFATILGFFSSALHSQAADADEVLYNFATHVHRTFVTGEDAEITQVVSQGEPALRVCTGVKREWPGATFKAPSGRWDLSRKGELRVRVRNASKGMVTVYCRVDNAGADGISHCVTGSVRMEPEQTRVLTVPLKRTSDDNLNGKLFGMRGYPAKVGGPNTVDPSRLTQLLFFVAKPSIPHVFDILDIRAAGDYTPPVAFSNDAEPFFPLIDKFGQYRHKPWPGKVASLDDLKARHREELAELDQHPGPSNWNQYGGSKSGPKLEATGFFRTEKVNGKWWLVDPEGRLFFSHGIDCVGMANTTCVEERESWFHEFPGDDQSFAEFLGREWALKGYFAGKTVRRFDFSSANLKRKHGESWRQTTSELTHRRLRSWGLNTIGNWSSERIWKLRRTPYTDNVGSGSTKMIEGSEGYWGKFPDVFDESFGRSLRESMASKKGGSLGDPWCIGYFSDNEMSWGDDTSLAIAALKSPPKQPAKIAFVADLRSKYSSVDRLNQAWKTSHRSWEAVLEFREPVKTDDARADLLAFYTKAAELYFRTVRDTIKAAGGNHLYLGCRFAGANSRAAAAAAKFCDVVSYNIYERSVADFEFDGGADVPLILGEFHFGALDRGLFHTGLVPVSDQNARAQAYLDYVLGALRHPRFVGAHWFQYQDEATTGRVWDEENYQIGFVDIADTPYPEMLAASREVGARLYSELR